MALIKLIRPWHWIKNALVLAPLVFSGLLFDAEKLRLGLLGFAVFCLVASAVYVFNDLRDIENDRAHPEKCKRPLASGQVQPGVAVGVVAGLLVAAAVLVVACGGVAGWWLLVVYLVLNIAYSMGLKEVPIIDIAILASGYVIRVLYGGAVCAIPVSGWLFLTVLAASFYLGLGKRRGELLSQGGQSATRKVLAYYTRSFLDNNMYLFLALANVFYALWARETGGGMLLSVPIVLIMSMRYSLDIDQGTSGDPIEVILGDPALVGLAVLYAACVLSMLYAQLHAYLPLW